MTKKYLLVGSGFLIPSNSLFVEIDKDPTYKESVIGAVDAMSKDKILSRIVEDGGVYSSAVCNEAFLQYQEKPKSFDTYIRLVNIMADIFDQCDFKDFLLVQSRNTFLSPVGFKLVTDILGYRILDTYRDYLILPSFFRIPDQSKIDLEELDKRQNYISKMMNDNVKITASDFVADLATNKEVLAAVFKFMLTDSNRGAAYG